MTYDASTHHLTSGPVDRDRIRIRAELAAIDAHTQRGSRLRRRLFGRRRATR